MAVSAETQAILDELKNQGELTRSKDRNFSMKTSQQSFEKFSEAFDTISQTMQDQTNILKETLGISIEAAKAQEKAAKLSSIQQTREADTAVTAGPREIAQQGDSLLGLIGKSLGGLGGVFKTLLIGGGIGFVAYNFAKGFIDRTFGEGTVDEFTSSIKTFMIESSESIKENAMLIPGLFLSATNFKGALDTFSGVFDTIDWEGVIKPKIEEFQNSIKDIDFSSIGTNLTNLNLNLGNINGVFSGITNWDELKLSMTNLADKLPDSVATFTDFLSNPMTYILPALTGAIATRAAISGVAGAAIPGSPNGQSPVRNLKNGIIGSFALGMTIYGNRLKDWINNESGLADVDVGAQDAASLASMGVDIGTGALQGASIGMFFGPTGALVGAILGGTVTLGVKLFNWWQGKNAENEREALRIQQEADALIASKRAEYERTVANLANMTPEQQEAAIDNMSDAEVEVVNRITTDNPIYDYIAEVIRLRGETTNLMKGGSQMQSATTMKLNQLKAAQRELQEFLDTGGSAAQLQAVADAGLMGSGGNVFISSPTNISPNVTSSDSVTVNSASATSVGGNGNGSGLPNSINE